MTRLAKLEFVDFGPCKIVGKSIVTKGFADSNNPIPALWGQCFSDNTFSTLENMKEYMDRDAADDAYVGYMCDFNPETQEFIYVVGAFMKPECPVPEGFAAYDIKKSKIAKAWIEGEEPEVFSDGFNLLMKAIEDNGYKANNFSAEVYTCSRYSTPKSKGEKTVILDYYIEVLPK